MTKVIQCSCKNEFQDKEYGPGRRLANKTAKPPDSVRCTVCGTVHQDRYAVPKKIK